MGRPAQVKIIGSEGPPVYLYSHWTAETIEADVSRALARHERWDNAEYLARIIFEEMIPHDQHRGTEGFGIGTVEGEDNEKLITVNPTNRTVTVEGEMDFSFDAFASIGEKNRD